MFFKYPTNQQDATASKSNFSLIDWLPLIIIGVFSCLTACGSSVDDGNNYKPGDQPINNQHDPMFTLNNDNPEQIKFRKIHRPSITNRENFWWGIMGGGGEQQLFSEEGLKLPFNADLVGLIDGNKTLDDSLFIPRSKAEELWVTYMYNTNNKPYEVTDASGNKIKYEFANNSFYTHVAMGVIKTQFKNPSLDYPLGTTMVQYLVGNKPTPIDSKDENAMPQHGKYQYEVLAVSFDYASGVLNGREKHTPTIVPIILVVDFDNKTVTGNLGNNYYQVYGEIKGNKFSGFKNGKMVLEGGFYGPQGLEFMGYVINVFEHPGDEKPFNPRAIFVGKKVRPVADKSGGGD